MQLFLSAVSEEHVMQDSEIRGIQQNYAFKETFITLKCIIEN